MPPPPPLEIEEDPEAFAELRDQLAEYFTGQREQFDLELDLRGTPFQVRVWKQLLKIPYGKLRTYGQIAPGAALAPVHPRGGPGQRPQPAAHPRALPPCDRPGTVRWSDSPAD